MRSKISCCNGAVLHKNLTRFAPLWIGYLALWILIVPLAILSQGRMEYFDIPQLQQLVYENGLRIGNLINAVYAILMAMALYGWMYQTRSVNTIAALPVRRETMALTNLISALLMSLVPCLLVALLGFGASALVGYPSGRLMLHWLGIVMAEFLFYFGLASFCASIVSQLLALPVIYGLLNFAAVVLNYVTVSVLSTFVYGMSNSGYAVLGKFSPFFQIFSRLHASPQTELLDDGSQVISAYTFSGWKYLGAIAVVGAVLLVAAVLLFRIRRMESAGDVIAFRPLRPVFKYCVTASCSLVLGVLAATLFFSGYHGPTLPVMTLCLLAGGFVGYFASEILLKKTFRVFRKEWIGFGAFAACLLLAIALMEFDAFGFERYVPDVDEVESVTVSFSGSSENAVVTDEPHIVDLITLHQTIIQNKAQQESLARMDPGADETRDRSNLRLIYQLKNGDTMLRSYRVYCTESLWLDPNSLPRQLAAVLSDPYMVTLANTPDYDVDVSSVSNGFIQYYDPETHVWQELSLSSKEAFDLYTNCVLPDLQDGLLHYATPYNYDYTGNACRAEFYVEFSHMVPSPGNPNQHLPLSWDFFDYTPTEGSRLAKAIEELTGISLITDAEFEAQQATEEAR